METFARWDLQINDGKTEWLSFEIGREEWKSSRQLGSLLGDDEDLVRRKALASSAYRSLYCMFLRRRHISLERRLKLYNAFVLPVLLYNCSTWALTQSQATSLSAFHRRQLRSVLGIRWPDIISNVELYRRTRQADVMSMVNQARLRLLGHCLRMDTESPPQRALDLYCNTSLKGRRGRPKTTLGSSLRHDVGLTASTLRTLREEAADRHGWRTVIHRL